MIHRGTTPLARAIGWTLLLGGVLLARPLAAQRASVEALDRLPPALRLPAQAVADSVAHVGLPASVVVDKALEGASKGASDERILAAMRRVAADLGAARAALGVASADELAAGGSALRTGVPAASLTGLRQRLGNRSLVVPISVLASLVAQHADLNESVASVVTLSERAPDATLLAFQQSVARSISNGSTAASAIASGMNAAGTGTFAPAKPLIPLPPRKKTKP